jgi:hypothetical protein
MSSILPGDFLLPSDTSFQPSLSITFESLDLFSTAESVHSTSTDEPSPLTDVSDEGKIQTYSAMMRFTSVAEGEEKREVNVSLTHDVYFVTAHPCIPSPHAEILKMPTSPTSVSSNSPKFLGMYSSFLATQILSLNEVSTRRTNTNEVTRASVA